MKQVFLIILVICSLTMWGHEVTTNLAFMGDPDGDGDTGMGFKIANLALWWGNDSYLVDIGLAYDLMNNTNTLNLSKAWKKVDLWGMGDLTIGKQQYSFGRILTSKGYKNLQIRALDIAPAEWMFKYHKGFGNFHAYIDAVWPQNGNADLGGRLKYFTDHFKTGAAFHAIDFGQIAGGDTENIHYYWEADLEFDLFNFLKLAGQVRNIDDGNDDTDDIGYYVMASYAPGFEFPYLGEKLGRVMYGEFRPYAGMITHDDVDGNDMGENNIFVGINFMSYENSYLKLEYTMDSDENIDPTLAAQLGYRF